MAEQDNEPSDEELVQQTQDGDSHAFGLLVRRYSSRLYGLVYNMTSNHEDTNDLLQDIFSKAFRAIKGFKGRSSIYTWMHTIAVNMTINFLKKRGRTYKMSLDDLDSGVHADPQVQMLLENNTPVREMGLAELQEKLNEAMQKLSTEHRMVVTMFDIQGMPHKEIAQILGISEGTVRSRLFYAHKQLQALLRDFRPS
ncbi:MAG: sigma-70 family RNA polymerase sigma factor [Verrucomicrobiales bacterium]